MSTLERMPQGAVDALYAMGHGLYESARYTEAAVLFRAMLLAAPVDERAWVALGACHEELGHANVAFELYGMGCAAAAPAPRCELARARALRARDRHADADEAIVRAAQAAESLDDEVLRQVIEAERNVS